MLLLTITGSIIFLLYLQRSKQHHFLFCTVYVLQENRPASLLIQLRQTHHIILEQRENQFSTSFSFMALHIITKVLPWDPYHGKCSIWNEAIVCHSLVFPAALVNEMNPTTSGEQRSIYFKGEMWNIIFECELFLGCTWCEYVFCPPHWLAGRV